MTVTLHVALLAVVGVISAPSVQSSFVEAGSPLLYCNDFKPQTSLDVHQITGMWYGSELLQHHDGDNRSAVVNSCVVIHISETSHEQTTTLPPEYGDAARHRGYYDRSRVTVPTTPGYAYLRLIWDENGFDREVSIRFNRSRPGFWMATSGPVHGASVTDPAYQIFTGTLQVMKAVDDHLVITFCQTFRETGELFSILLTRRPNTLTPEETSRIRSMLQRRGLSTASVRKVCASGARALAWGGGGVWAVAIAMAAMMWKNGAARLE